MNVRNLMVNAIRHSAVEIFATMLSVDIKPEEVLLVEPETPDANDGMVSFIGLAGTWTGTASLTCSPALACRVCSQVLVTGAPDGNEGGPAAAAEMDDRIFGN